MRGSRIVFIGKDLDKVALEKGLKECLVKAPAVAGAK